MKKQLFFVGVLAAVAGFTACSSDENDTPAPQILSTTVTNLNIDTASTGKFTLYSLSENKIIPNSDSATTKWDIGFQALNVIVNGGVSGPGKTQAQFVTGVFANLTTAPTTGYATDSTAVKVAKAWYNYNFMTHIVTAIPGKVIMLKTTNNNYAKIEIFSYYKDAPAAPTGTEQARLLNFRYVYQPNGSVNFK
ncbi:heme-binding HmuY-like protein [Chitinophaga skermanii]|uniref:Heme-binding HmuY-like protein n=1 Tax=Chitinophaga skermanii TaxID=331697 RepID=A0A327Q098_9BACT|nr:HmuY family protein [Chitinophaga skermanii]RAI97870.1 heme-binding HmuY-like protein [Chitinophaga skermanii]